MSKIGFEFGMWRLSALASACGKGIADLEPQVQIAQSFFTDADLRFRATAAIANLGRHVFAEQHVTRLMRLLVLHGADRPLSEVNDDEAQTLERAYLAMGSITDGGYSDVPSTEQALMHVVRSAAFTATEPMHDAIQRAYVMWIVLAERDDLRDAQITPNVWAAADHGLDIEQQLAIALGAVGHTGAASDNLDEPRHPLEAGWMGTYADSLGVDIEAAYDCVAADRDWYRDAFAPRADDPNDLLWNRVPFDRRPLMRVADGRMVVISPRALIGWLTDGVYHRAAESARRRGKSTAGRFGDFAGRLAETYSVELMQSVLDANPADVVRGDFEYQHPLGTRRTPDIIITQGRDIVMVEMYSGRLTLPALIDGEVFKDIDTKVVGKARQLNDRINDFDDGYWSAGEITTGEVKRVWPMLVVPHGLPREPLLMDYLRASLSDQSTPTSTQPLTLLDIGELETLAGLVEEGNDLIEILAAKTAPAYRDLELRRLFWDPARSLNPYARASLIRERTNAVTDALINRLKKPPS